MYGSSVHLPHPAPPPAEELFAPGVREVPRVAIGGNDDVAINMNIAHTVSSALHFIRLHRFNLINPNRPFVVQADLTQITLLVTIRAHASVFTYLTTGCCCSAALLSCGYEDLILNFELLGAGQIKQKSAT